MEDLIIQYVNDDCNILTAMQTNTYLMNMLLNQKKWDGLTFGRITIDRN
jgi:MoaA/NifB/PqqE/SkfB family radical SAM enzyme